MAKLLGIGCKLEPLTIHCIEATALTRYLLKPNKMNKFNCDCSKQLLEHARLRAQQVDGHLAGFRIEEARILLNNVVVVTSSHLKGRVRIRPVNNNVPLVLKFCPFCGTKLD